MRLIIQNHLAQPTSLSLFRCAQTRLLSILPPCSLFSSCWNNAPRSLLWWGVLRNTCYLVSLLLIVFVMINVIMVSMCFNGDVCLLVVCVCHLKGKNMETEGRMSLQVCLEANQMVPFSSDAFWFSVWEFQTKNRMASFCKGLLMWLFHGLVLPVQKATPGLGCVDTLVIKEFTPWH